MASAFIIQVQPQLQRDPNEETAALLRVLIHKIDNTTFGGDVPALPQWTGPTRMVIHVQSILYASLAASLLSAFLAMLGKQWLNRYASIDMRGSVIERSRNRQRKLDGIIAWYFEHVLECLPLMLQVALLLLGCALSRYLWEINTAVASVVIGVTSFGMVFYLFIIAAGATSDGCPYQTPWTNIVRRLLHLLSHPVFYLTRLHIKNRILTRVVLGVERKCGTIIFLLILPPVVLAAIATNAFLAGRTMFRSLVVSAREVRSWSVWARPVPEQALDYQATALDFRCISWILRTSLDKTVNLLTLNFLKTILANPSLKTILATPSIETILAAPSPKTILATPGSNTDIAVGCLNAFSSCFVVDNHGWISVTRGSEQVVDMSAMCFLRVFSSLLITTPTPSTIEDVRQRYGRAFPSVSMLRGSPYYPHVNAIHRLFRTNALRRSLATGDLRTHLKRTYFPDLAWTYYNPPLDELVPFAQALAQVAQSEYQSYEGGNPKVPRWLLRFALRFLSKDPLPPISVVINCLTIIATDLGCNVSDINSMPLDERCAHAPSSTVSLLTLHQHTA